MNIEARKLNLIQEFLKIVQKAEFLKNQPEIGVVEELLKGRRQEFRYVLSGNYKILYYTNLSQGRIIIANVFDTRQNPKKIDFF